MKIRGYERDGVFTFELERADGKKYYACLAGHGPGSFALMQAAADELGRAAKALTELPADA